MPLILYAGKHKHRCKHGNNQQHPIDSRQLMPDNLLFITALLLFPLFFFLHVTSDISHVLRFPPVRFSYYSIAFPAMVIKFSPRP